MTAAHPALTGGPVHLDHDATTAPDPRVIEAMRPCLTRDHQPRARHSGIAGRSAPSVVSLPWPG